MFAKILFPTDFSELSEKALSYIVKLKDAGTEEVILLHVIDTGNLDALIRYSPLNLMDARNEARDKAMQKMATFADFLQKKGLKVKIRIEEGTPFDIILKVENEERVSNIVMSSHGMSNIKEMLLGSVSEQVIRNSKTPIIIIKR
ncbi:MAG: universal stress protein [Syntrophales bacterium]|jgi:nucleotide-binding universal stress UspA family protein|nr:universal stress protein [Syntrophales bacterium]MDY0043419.1 universal stress protein [Syntrophales bacterium]